MNTNGKNRGVKASRTRKEERKTDKSRGERDARGEKSRKEEERIEMGKQKTEKGTQG